MLGGLAGTEGRGKMLALAVSLLLEQQASRRVAARQLSHNLWRDLSGRSVHERIPAEATARNTARVQTFSLNRSFKCMCSESKCFLMKGGEWNSKALGCKPAAGRRGKRMRVCEELCPFLPGVQLGCSKAFSVPWGLSGSSSRALS